MDAKRSRIQAGLAAGLFCIAAVSVADAGAQAKEMVQPTGTTGATAFQPGGAARQEVEAGSSAGAGDAVPKPSVKPGFDNKPPKNAKAACSRPQGGVDASGGENIQTAAKDNTHCTSPAARKR